jgi:histidinol-phosphate aminotransferase
VSVNLSRRELLRISGALAAGAAAPQAPGAAAPARPLPGAGPARLSFNENPYGPGPAARAAIVASTGDAWKYAVAEEMALRARIAAREGVAPAQVVIGAGSSEILHLAALAAGGGELVTATPTFGLMAEEVRHAGGSVREVPLDAELRFDLAALRAAVTPATRLVYVCNPNNPTGTRVDGAALRAFIAGLPPAVTVVVDEAYLELASDMAEHSALASVKAGANVIVARTFSKLHGLAGLRVGYALARPDLAERLGKLKSSSVNGLGLAAATASYEDTAFQDGSRRRLAEGLAITVEAVRSLGLRQAVSHANFAFFDTGAPLASFMSAMRERGYSVGRPFPPYDTWCRVSVGTVEQMRGFAAALRAHYGR